MKTERPASRVQYGYTCLWLKRLKVGEANWKPLQEDFTDPMQRNCEKQGLSTMDQKRLAKRSYELVLIAKR